MQSEGSGGGITRTDGLTSDYGSLATMNYRYAMKGLYPADMNRE